MKAAVYSRLLLVAAQTNDSERDSARTPTATNERISTTDHVITNTTTLHRNNNSSCLSDSVCQSVTVSQIAAVCVRNSVWSSSRNVRKATDVTQSSFNTGMDH